MRRWQDRERGVCLWGGGGWKGGWGGVSQEAQVAMATGKRGRGRRGRRKEKRHTQEKANKTKAEEIKEMKITKKKRGKKPRTPTHKKGRIYRKTEINRPKSTRHIKY